MSKCRSPVDLSSEVFTIKSGHTQSIESNYQPHFDILYKSTRLKSVVLCIFEKEQPGITIESLKITVLPIIDMKANKV